MLICGLTGSMAMGKSTVAAFFKAQNVPVISADDIVHKLYQGRAAPLIEAAFPGSTSRNNAGRKPEVDRQKLMARLNETADGLNQLEKIIHPLVREEEWAFIKQQKQLSSPLVLIEIPLLFETGADQFMDLVIVVSAPPDVQRARALKRSNMNEQKFEKLLANQMPDEEKRRRADYIINTGTTEAETQGQISALLPELLSAHQSEAYEKWKTEFALEPPEKQA